VDIRPFVESRCSQIMSPPEVHEVAAAGYGVELHTHRHRTPEDPALFRREIDDNRRAILEMTGGSPVHFCYPGGAYRRAFPAWLEEANVVSATTCDSGLASPGDHPLLLPRVTDHSQLSTEEFVSWISGVRYLMTGARPRRGAGAER
jgi:peptidoglycan/xylan/chitin deacetylase (PgdA/CDA1 family)